MSALDKLRAYFLANIGKKMSSSELRKVAGNITEWGRRAASKDQLEVLHWLIRKFPKEVEK